MNTVDSRVISVERRRSVYVTSEPQGSDWGQPAASQYRFEAIGGALRGAPVASLYWPPRRSEHEFDDSGLTLELEAWEAASDEALANFEASLE